MLLNKSPKHDVCISFFIKKTQIADKLGTFCGDFVSNTQDNNNFQYSVLFPALKYFIILCVCVCDMYVCRYNSEDDFRAWFSLSTMGSGDQTLGVWLV